MSSKKYIISFLFAFFFLFVIPGTAVAFVCCSHPGGSCITDSGCPPDDYCCGSDNTYYLCDNYCDFCVIHPCNCFTSESYAGDCDSFDGFVGDYYCVGNTIARDYRDYYCSGGDCPYTETIYYGNNCDDYDGCVGDDYRDYYCSGGNCTYEVNYNDSRCIICECSTDSDCGPLAYCSGDYLKDYDCADGCNCSGSYNCNNSNRCDNGSGDDAKKYRDYYCSTSGNDHCTYDLICKEDSCGAECEVDGDCPTGSVCQADCTCSGICSGRIDVYPETDTAPCDFTIDIYNVDNCQGETWRVERNGSYVDSGTVGSNDNWEKTLSDNNLDANSYDYDLYIDGDWKDWDSVNCSAAACDCTSWTSQSCGYSSCSWYEKGQTRTCTPSGCDTEFRCICSESCCASWSDQGCGAGGCTGTEMYQTRDCGTCSYSTSKCASDLNCGGVVTINPPQVTTVGATNVTQTSATLNGNLDSLGYDPAACPNCQSIVWFEWGLTTSYGNKTTPVSMTATGPFAAIISTLSPGITYYFEAFAKNGGSW